ncbi:MAG: polysaccharide pyruvyl transferase CsaB [Bacillota bacterium]|nr:polysaccharide pyruvyl transferase CsaB [Bacillota bacterium]
MKALIIGYYGSDNIGDEVLLHQTIKMIKEIDEKIDIKSLSYRTKTTKEIHGIDAVSRNKYFEIIKAIKESDIVIGGGGSILQNVTSNRSLVYYSTILFISTLFNKKVIMLGNGFGPIKGKFYTSLTRWLLNKIDVFMARDEETKERLEKLGVESKIVLSADLAYYNYKCKERLFSKKVIINIRPWENSDVIIKEMNKFINRLKENGYEVEFLSMQEGNDDLLLRKIDDKASFVDNSIDAFLHEESDYYCMVGMRLHALIWAGIKDIPFISLEYDPKIKSYADMTNQLNCGNVNDIDSDKLWELFTQLVDNYDEKKNLLIKTNDELAKKSYINYMELKNLIERN